MSDKTKTDPSGLIEWCRDNCAMPNGYCQAQCVERRCLACQSHAALQSLKSSLHEVTTERDVLRNTASMQDDLLNQHTEQLEKNDDSYRRICREKVVQHQRAEKAEAERDDAVKLMQTAYDDGERAIAEVTKLRLDLECLEQSTVDSKAYDALVAELEDLR